MIITITRKPFKGGVIEAVSNFQCGGINIENCRIEFEGKDKRGTTRNQLVGSRKGIWSEELILEDNKTGNGFGGRWPANIILSVSVTNHFPNSIGWSSQNHNSFNIYGGRSLNSSRTERGGFKEGYNDSGCASRYFKVVK